MIFWDGAERPFRKTLIGHVKAAVETRSVIFPSDRCGQFNQLLIVEILAQIFDLLIGRRRRRIGEGDRVVENVFFEIAERGARPMVGEIAELVFGDVVFSADGRADVESEEASDHRCSLERGQTL